MALLDGSRFLRSAPLRELVSAPVRGLGFFVRAWSATFVVEASLRSLGYRRTVEWIEQQKRPSKKGVSVALGARLVTVAYKMHVFRGGCLPQSLVQYLLHQRDGTEARFVVGVRRGTSVRNPPVHSGATRPLANVQAHAWVEGEDETSLGFSPIFQTKGARSNKE